MTDYIEPTPVVCFVKAPATVINEYFIGSLIEKIRNHAKSLKGLTWFDHSEVLAYSKLTNDSHTRSLIGITGVWPIRDMYGPALQKYQSFTYEDVEYRLVPISEWETLHAYLVYNAVDSLM